VAEMVVVKVEVVVLEPSAPQLPEEVKLDGSAEVVDHDQLPCVPEERPDPGAEVLEPALAGPTGADPLPHTEDVEAVDDVEVELDVGVVLELLVLVEPLPRPRPLQVVDGKHVPNLDQAELE